MNILKHLYSFFSAYDISYLLSYLLTFHIYLGEVVYVLLLHTE